PAADHVLVLAQGLQELGDLRRIILKVSVEGYDGVPPGSGEPGGEGRRLAEVATEAQTPDARTFRRQLDNHWPRAVPTTVVHEDQLEVKRGTLGNLHDLAVQDRQAFFFVEKRHDNGDHVSECNMNRASRIWKSAANPQSSSARFIQTVAWSAPFM